MSNTYQFSFLCDSSEIPTLGARRVATPLGEIAVFKTKSGAVRALKNECPHKKGPLSEGIVHGESVTCPLHNWVISLETGEALGADVGCTQTYAAEIRNGSEVWLGIPADETAPAS